MRLSMEGVGALVTLIQLGLQYFNIQAPEGTIIAFVNALVTLIGAILLLVGQYRREDTTMFVFKR